MKTTAHALAALGALALAGATAHADSGDDLSWSELVDPASISEIEVDRDDGEVTFEIEYTRNGEEWELEVAPDGVVLEHERD